MLKVLVADTQPLFAECLATALSMQHELKVLDERPALGLRAVEAAIEGRPDVVVMDYWMPDMGGPAAAAVVAARTHRPVVLLSWFFGPREVRTALAAGAAGMVPKTLGIGELVQALRLVGKGKRPVYPQALQPLVAPGDTDLKEALVWRRLSSLTDREIQILRLLGRGDSKSTIATILAVSPETARTHIENIRRKLDARTQMKAVAIARQHGFIPP